MTINNVCVWKPDLERKFFTSVNNQLNLKYLCNYDRKFLTVIKIYVTIFGKIDYLRASLEIHFLCVHESYVHSCTI